MKKLHALATSAVLALLFAFPAEPLSSETIYGQTNFDEDCVFCQPCDPCNCAYGCSGNPNWDPPCCNDPE